MAPKANSMNAWAQLGASTRLAQLERERAAILAAFPKLRHAAPTEVLVRPKRRISAKARQAMKEGMKRYWARRKAAAKRSGD
jgi:hypothetical protein